MRVVALCLVLPVVLLGGCAVTRSRPAPPPFSPVVEHGFQLIDGPDGRYYAFLPKDAAQRVASGEKLPVILYLHGGDERGSDPLLPTQVGLGPFVEAAHADFPFVVLFPQCPRGQFWASPAQLARLTRVLDDALARLHGDADRVYLTGNSLGGYGTWLLAAEHPDRFAAIVPICGGVKPPRLVPIPKGSRFGRLKDPFTAVAKAIGAVPTWAFNGDKDWLVSPEQSKKIVRAMQANGNPARQTIFPGVGHPSWNNAYAEPELFTWLAAQRRQR